MMKRISTILDFANRGGNVSAARKPLWTLAVLAATMLVTVTLALCQEKTGTNNSDAPKIVKIKPDNGAKNVDSATIKELRVTFDKDMSSRGYSWTGGGEKFPKTTGKPKWIDKRTCVLPVELEPGKEYQLGINSASFKNFRSEEGVPVEPVRYQFSTGGKSPKKEAELAEVDKTSTFLDDLPTIKSSDNDAKPLPDGLLAEIQKKREAIKSAEYTVQSVTNPAQKNFKAITKTARFRFQGNEQWFIDLSEVMAHPDLKSDPKTFLSGCVGDEEWSYINNRYLEKPMYNVREWKDIKEKSLSFLDPFKSKGSTVAEIQKRLDDQKIRYFGEGEFKGKRIHLFGFQNETKSPIDEKTLTTTGEIGIDAETLLPVYSRAERTGNPNGTSVSGYLFNIVSLNKEYAADDFHQKADTETKPELKTEPDEGYQKFFIHIDDGAGGRMVVRANGQSGTKGTSSSGLN